MQTSPSAKAISPRRVSALRGAKLKDGPEEASAVAVPSIVEGDVISFKESKAEFALLIEKGADVNAKSASGVTPAGLAWMARNDPMRSMLQARGAQ